MFKKAKKETQDVFVTLSSKSITIAYNELTELQIISYEFEIATDINTLMKDWRDGIEKILSGLKFTPQLILLINSTSFLVKNIYDIASEDGRYEYISEQLGISKGYFEISQIKNSSYLVVENRSIEKILFAFKDYHIKSFHDISIVNSLYFIKEKSDLYINISLESLSIVMDGEVFQKRGNSRLFINYLEKSAKRLNLDLDSAYEHITKSFNKIESYKELESSTLNGANDLRYFIDDLVDYIEKTLIYFSNYESVEYIEKIYLDGDVLELDFIKTMIQDRLNIDNIVLAHNSLMVSDYKQVSSIIASDSQKEMLQCSTVPLDGLRYSDGKQEYIFVDDSLVTRKSLNKKQKKRVLSFKRVVDIKEYKKSNKSIWKMSGGELIELAKSRLFSENKEPKESSKKSDLDELEEEEETGKIIFLLFLLIAGGVYYLWLYIDDLERNFKNKVYDYERNIKSVDIANEKLSNTQITFVESGVNKILWTEKFITIAKSMPDEIWFSSIRLENIEKEIEGKKVTSSRVVLEGRSLPSFTGHVSTIANYMESLMNSDSNFRRDFINVSFAGAESLFDESGRTLISFRLYCNFRRNINIQTIKKESSPKDNSIAENISSIKKNIKKKEQTLKSIGKE